MKNVSKREGIGFALYCLLWIVSGLAVLRVEGWRPALFFFLPLVGSALVYLTFLWTWHGKRSFGLALFTILRVAILVAMIFVPAAVWHSISSIRESVSAFYLLVSPFEALSVYILALVIFLMNRKFRE